MTIQEAQEKIDNWIKQYGVRYYNELTNMAILTEEVGEVAKALLEGSRAEVKAELIQVAAVIVTWLRGGSLDD